MGFHGEAQQVLEVVQLHAGRLEFEDGRPPWRCPHRHRSEDEARDCLWSEDATGEVSFRLKLRQLREAAGLTLIGAAERAGSTESTIQRLELGTVCPQWTMVAELLHQYGAEDAQELLDWYRKIRRARMDQRQARQRATREARWAG